MSQLQVTGEAKIRDIQGPVVANDGVITALDGAASQYVRGDGTLADFPTSSGGGSSVSYYLNSSVSQGTIGGVAYRQLSKTPISGAGTDITISANGYVANYITDANDPSLLEVPAGNFNCEFYFSVNSNNHNPYVYAELYKYDGTTFTLLGSNQAIPEYLTNGTTLSAYYFAIPVAVAALTITDRIAIRIYVNVDGRTVTLHTENNHLCQVVTTFSKGLTSLNNLTRQVQFLATGTSGTDFNISSSTATHTFNIPVASATNTGKLSSTDWSTFNNKQPAGNYVTLDTTQTITGAKTFDAAYFNGAEFNNTAYFNQGLWLVKNGVPIVYTALQTTIYSEATTNNVVFRDNVSKAKLEFNNSTQTYTFPAITGTLALLEGSQTFTGVKTFSDNPIINGGGTNSAYTILQSAGTNKWRIGNNYASGVNTFDIFSYDNSSTPLSINSNGAMTLSANVTTTGAQFVQNGFYLTNANGGSLAGYTHMWARNEGINFGLRNGTGGASFIFPSANSYNYTFPAATGTLALTSNLSAYLPLTGGTLTGALSGTSATFSGAVTNQVNNISADGAGVVLQGYVDNSLRIAVRGSGYNSGARGGLLASTGDFSSSVTATQINASANFYASSTAPTLVLTNAAQSTTFGYLQHNGTDLSLFNTINGATIFASNNTERMRITSGGNVGIGTSSPVNTLTIQNTGENSIEWHRSNAMQGMIGIPSASNQIITGSSLNDFCFRATSKMLFATGGDTERMRITSGGNVLIGTTTSGSYKLVVSGASGGGVLSTATGAGDAGFFSSSDSIGYHFYCDRGSSARFYVIGTGQIYSTSTSITAISDIRHKENIRPLETGLAQILQLKPSRFDWKEGKGTGKKDVAGFIAQDIEQVLPDLVDEWKETMDATEPFKSIRMGDLIPTLVKAIQEQQAQIEELSNKIVALESK